MGRFNSAISKQLAEFGDHFAERVAALGPIPVQAGWGSQSSAKVRGRLVSKKASGESNWCRWGSWMIVPRWCCRTPGCHRYRMSAPVALITASAFSYRPSAVSGLANPTLNFSKPVLVSVEHHEAPHHGEVVVHFVAIFIEPLPLDPLEEDDVRALLALVDSCPKLIDLVQSAPPFRGEAEFHGGDHQQNLIDSPIGALCAHGRVQAGSIGIVGPRLAATGASRRCSGLR